MPILIKDRHLESQVIAEQERRGDAAKGKTAQRLILERLTELEVERRGQRDGNGSNAQPLAPQDAPQHISEQSQPAVAQPR